MNGLQHVVKRVKHAARLASSVAREQYKRKTRSPKWERYEKEFIAKNPTCAACGGKKHLQAHHKKPYHVYPALELEFTNLIALCMGFECEAHLLLGHGDNWQCWNEGVESDAAIVLANPSLRDEYVAKAKLNRKR